MGLASTRSGWLRWAVGCGLLPCLALVALMASCDLPRRARFTDSELLLALGGEYTLGLSDAEDPDDFELSVDGESVTARLGRDAGWFGPHTVVYVDAVAEGRSVIALRLRGRVLDRLTIDVAAVEAVQLALMVDGQLVLMQAPFGVLQRDSVILRIEGTDAGGRIFDAQPWGTVEADDGATFLYGWENIYAFEGRIAGAVRVTVDVGGGRMRETSVQVVAPDEITGLQVERLDESYIWVAGTTDAGLRVWLLDAVVSVDGVTLSDRAGGFYPVDDESLAGAVVTARWSDLSTTHAF